MKNLKLIIAATFAVVALYACGGSGNKDAVETADSVNEEMDTTTMATDSAGGVAEFDATFAVDAANGGMAEVALGSLAEQKATNADVKAFAMQMVKDHTKANAELTALATAKNITLPATVSDENKKVADDLGKKMGADFDKGYVDQMVADHDKTVALFEDAVNNAVDENLKAFAAKTLPVLKAHQAHIKAIKDKMK